MSKPFPWFYAVNDRPVKIVQLADGTGDALVFDWTTGGFVSDLDYMDAISNPEKDVDQLTEEQFKLKVAALRIPIVQALCDRALTWSATGNALFPFETVVDGRTITLRINDFPAEPLHTLMTGEEEIVDLDDWPRAWERPQDPR